MLTITCPPPVVPSSLLSSIFVLHPHALHTLISSRHACLVPSTHSCNVLSILLSPPHFYYLHFDGLHPSALNPHVLHPIMPSILRALRLLLLSTLSCVPPLMLSTPSCPTLLNPPLMPPSCHPHASTPSCPASSCARALVPPPLRVPCLLIFSAPNVLYPHVFMPTSSCP
jgi:hypothetical protein